MKYCIAVIGNTVEDAEEWAKGRVPEPYECFGVEDHVDGLRLIAAVIAPGTDKGRISEHSLSEWGRATVGYHTSVESELCRRKFAEVVS